MTEIREIRILVISSEQTRFRVELEMGIESLLKKPPLVRTFPTPLSAVGAMPTPQIALVHVEGVSDVRKTLAQLHQFFRHTKIVLMTEQDIVPAAQNRSVAGLIRLPMTTKDLAKHIKGFTTARIS